MGRLGGARLTDGGSEEGSLGELEEFWFSRNFSSASSRSNCAIWPESCDSAPCKARWVASGIIFQNCFAMGDYEFMPPWVAKCSDQSKTTFLGVGAEKGVKSAAHSVSQSSPYAGCERLHSR